MRDERLEKVAETLYSSELPYHNFGHAIDAVTAGEKVIRRCQAEGVSIDEPIVYYALLFHDAAYHEDHEALGFDTKEGYSAHLAATALAQRGVSSKTIEQVVAAIMSTHRDGEFVTVEQKAVRAADLSGLAADYEIFYRGAENLRREHELLTGEAVAWPQWAERVAETLRFYLSQDLRLSRYYSNGNGASTFQKDGLANLERLRRQYGLESAER